MIKNEVHCLLKLTRSLKERGIKLAIIEMESDGCYIAELRTIFVNQKLSEESMKEVIYHELKHGLDHSEFLELYNIPVFRSKMEAEADSYMFDRIIAEHGGEYNYSLLIEEFDIGMGYDIRFAR